MIGFVAFDFAVASAGVKGVNLLTRTCKQARGNGECSPAHMQESCPDAAC
jgi:hypothetical protein